MGRALELLTGFTTAPGTTFTALTMATGNSLTLRSADIKSDVLLLQAWLDSKAAGILRIRSPRMHDAVSGIRLVTPANQPLPLLTEGFPQKLFPQDVLTVENQGSAVAAKIETTGLLVYYDDLPGIEAHLITPDEVRKRMKNIFAVQSTLALGVAGGYSGEEAINTDFDQFKANTEYAILGYVNSVLCSTIRWRGSFSGNLGVGGPGIITLPSLTRNWFVRLSEAYDLALVPVFNSNDKAGVLIDGAQDDGGADPILSTIYAELMP